MSLLGRKPIVLPEGVAVAPKEGALEVRGPKGTLFLRLHPDMVAMVEGLNVVITPAAERIGGKGVSALWGTQWSLVRNAVIGVSLGFEKQLELQGVGYRAEVSGNVLRLNVGFTHPVELTAPQGITIGVEKNVVKVHGIDKQTVGEFAAAIRRVRPPEPYKGKGIRYVGEVVRRKEGKVVGATTSAGA